METIHQATSVNSPAAMARHYLARYWDGNLPVNPAAIADQVGVSIEGYSGLEFSGFFNRDNNAIIYNTDEPIVRRRFTVAHELGHFALGHSDAPRDKPSNFSASSSSPIEGAANRFAAELLMPAEAVKTVVRAGSMKSVDEMAQAFGVSKLAMTYRLTNLNLV